VGFLSELIDRIDAKLDRPADPRLLDTDRKRDSEPAAADTDSRGGGRRERTRRRPSWLTFGR
jgi:hypothetical protein